MTRKTTGRAAVALALALVGCDNEGAVLVLDGVPSAPRELEGSYYAGGVDLAWRLGPDWDGEVFRVYGKRDSDAEYYFIAEVTSCSDGRCVYRDLNVRPGAVYHYYVAAAFPGAGRERAGNAVEVQVPRPVAPPPPRRVHAVALDGAVYVEWDNLPASEEDFSFYAVYLDDANGDVRLGETDSPAFLDHLAENGRTYAYFVTSIDEHGHESGASSTAEATPRPDYAGEVLFARSDSAAASGFRFERTDTLQAVTDGADPSRHFRLEARAGGLWIELGEGVGVHSTTRATTALKCGPGSDGDCVSWEEAPASGYMENPVQVAEGTTLMFRVTSDGRQVRFGAVRVERAGRDQRGRQFMIFDWAYQTQINNRGLDKRGVPGSR